jgi:predicted NUDIX family phosphoesterase
MPADTDELVLAIPTATLFSGPAFQGLEPGGDKYLRRIFDPRHTRYIPRSEAESDPRWKQIIPYVILRCRNRVLRYARGRRSGETRLVSLHSVGLGGHIRHTDETVFAAPGMPAYRDAVEREMAEEVAIVPEIRVSDRIVAVINDDSVEVGTVHFGVVHIWDLSSDSVTRRETKILSPQFVAIEELRSAGAPTLETWSELCVRNWERIVDRPGWDSNPVT